MIALESHAEGVVLPVRAHPGARANSIRGEQNGALKVAVTQAPEKGKANKAIIELLAKQLRLRKSQLELLSGETSGAKRILVRGLSADDLRDRIRTATSDP
jgi:uncharacterized protein (TIGR00251 family)